MWLWRRVPLAALHCHQQGCLGVVFVAQGLLLLWASIGTPRIHFGEGGGAAAIVGWGTLAMRLRFTRCWSCGAGTATCICRCRSPVSVTIFTFGLLLLAAQRSRLAAPHTGDVVRNWRRRSVPSAYSPGTGSCCSPASPQCRSSCHAGAGPRLLPPDSGPRDIRSPIVSSVSLHSARRDWVPLICSLTDRTAQWTASAQHLLDASAGGLHRGGGLVRLATVAASLSSEIA